MSLRLLVNEFIPIRLAESGRESSTLRPLSVSRMYIRGADAWNSDHLFEMFLTKPRRKGVEPPGVARSSSSSSPSPSASRSSSDRSTAEISRAGEGGLGGGLGGDHLERSCGGDQTRA